MKKTEKIIIILTVVISIISLSVSLFKTSTKNQQSFVGNIVKDINAYGTSTVYTTATLTNSLATLLIPHATSSRIYGNVCMHYKATSTVWLFKQATSTGVQAGSGEPIYPSSTAASKTCWRIGADDAWLGNVWGISEVTTTVTIDYSQGLKN